MRDCNRQKTAFSLQNLNISYETFYQDIASYRGKVAAFKQQAKRNDLTVALFDTDVYQFSVKFFALNKEGITVVLPNNSKSITVKELTAWCDAFSGSDIAHSTINNLDDMRIEKQPFLERDCFWPVDGRVIFTTSGSTGKSKLIYKPVSALNVELDVLSKSFDFSAVSSFLATVPHFHIYGMLFRLLLPLKLQKTVFPLFEYPEDLEVILPKLSSCVIVSSPAFLKRLSKDNVLSPYAQNIHSIYCSGGKLEDSDSHLLHEQLLQPICQVYGSTESGGVAYKKHGGGQKPWETFQGITVEHTNTGQLAVYSPYLEQQPYVMDDLAEVNSPTEFWLLGRADRTIKIEEKRVNLAAIEALLAEHNWVEEARVLLLKGKRDILAAAVSLNQAGLDELTQSGKRFINKALKAHLLQQFEAVCIPRKWRYLESLPYNSQGKLIKAEMEALFE